jgi:hypothetical protein
MTLVTEEEATRLASAPIEEWPEVATRFQTAHPDWLPVEKDGHLIGFAINETEAQKMRDGWVE